MPNPNLQIQQLECNGRPPLPMLQVGTKERRGHTSDPVSAGSPPVSAIAHQPHCHVLKCQHVGLKGLGRASQEFRAEAHTEHSMAGLSFPMLLVASSIIVSATKLNPDARLNSCPRLTPCSLPRTRPTARELLRILHFNSPWVGRTSAEKQLPPYNKV